MQRQPDEAADHHAVEAYVLQIAAYAQFQFIDELALVPVTDCLRDVIGDALAQARCQAFRAAPAHAG